MSPHFALDRKAILVTGANSGIGGRIALTAAQHGADVAVHYLGATEKPSGIEHSVPGVEAAEAVVAEIRGLGRRAVAIEGDLARPDTPAALLTAAERELGPLHGLVNNAAHCELPDTVMEADWERYRRHYDVNLGAPTMLMSGFARRLSGRGQRGGRIVNISTDAARAFPGQIFYGTSKAALEAMTRAAAIELGPLGFGVNAVAPGPVQTGYIDDELAGKVMPAIPLRRLGTPDDIATAVAFLMSDAAEWITGQIIQVAGGHAL
ncbi:MAG TPA: SDR family oxidoreductase [Alphaproteobacteria bacterium]|nr:SDR family oxidoreductase [Alphaproteobacteria bacterium]